MRFLNGAPGLVLAFLAVAGAFQVYVKGREQRAVERARWVSERDSILQAQRRDSVEANVRDSMRLSTIRDLGAGIVKLTVIQREAGVRTARLTDSLRAVIDSSATPLLDSLEASHAREVLSLRQALVKADSIHTEDSLRVADRDRQLADLRSSTADAIHRADRFEKQANPGWVRRVVESPVTHIVAAGFGYVLGDK